MQLSLMVAGAVLCAVAGAGMYADYLGEQHARTAALRAEAEYAEGQMLPRTPSGTVRSLHGLIGYPDGAGPACGLMSSSAQREFAATYGQPDCPAAVQVLGARVTDRARYPKFRFAERAELVQGEDGSMDGCAITWRGSLDPPDMPDPGPRLGRFTLRRVAGMGFKITGVEPCAPVGPAVAPSSPPVASASPSTGAVSSTRPAVSTSSPAVGLLPGYAPSLPAILAGRIAVNDPGACGLFTDEGRAQFVAARKAADCVSAVSGMHAQVNDSVVYRSPLGATQAPGPVGRTVVDGCHLTWSTWSGRVVPGPQVGRLELEHPPGNVGYLIAGYRSC